MAEEETTAQPQPEVNRSQERITELSEKLKAEGAAKEAEAKARAEAEARATFAEGFADILGSYPAAKEHKEDIKTKVMAGYSVEDAALAVLGKAGKLGSVTPPPPPPPTPAGGSAATNISSDAQKPVAEMTQEERRAALEKELSF